MNISRNRESHKIGNLMKLEISRNMRESFAEYQARFGDKDKSTRFIIAYIAPKLDFLLWLQNAYDNVFLLLAVCSRSFIIRCIPLYDLDDIFTDRIRPVADDAHHPRPIQLRDRCVYH